jgi:hypothetical protein
MRLSIAAILFLRLVTASLSFAPCLLRAGITYVSEDHLVPKNIATDGALRPVFEKKLFVTPADCASVLIRPPETGEVAVALYRRRAGNIPDRFVVTVTKAEKNIDMTANVDSLEAADKIKVTRCDAEISNTAALTICAAWKVMLERTEESHVYARPTLHREELEFSIRAEGKTEVLAALPNRGGQSVSALIKLAKQLENYCNAPSAARRKLANRIERDAKRLTANNEGNGTKPKNK